MSKLSDEADDILYKGEWLTVRAITRPGGDCPAGEWFLSLDGKGKGQFLAAAKVLETSLRSKRPPAGRAGAITNSTEGLWELRITKKGGKPPHLRAFYVREGQVLWIATGITKKKNKLAARDIREADSIVAEWRSSR